MEKDYGQFHLRGENSKMLLEAQTCRLDQCKPQGCISQVSHGAKTGRKKYIHEEH